MTTGTADMAKKQTELEQFGQKIAEQLDKMEKNGFRLASIGNKLADESGLLTDSKPPQPGPYSPGMLNALNGLLDRLSELNRFQDSQISKLENLI